jgi:hypothetical protein
MAEVIAGSLRLVLAGFDFEGMRILSCNKVTRKTSGQDLDDVSKGISPLVG